MEQIVVYPPNTFEDAVTRTNESRVNNLIVKYVDDLSVFKYEELPPLYGVNHLGVTIVIPQIRIHGDGVYCVFRGREFKYKLVRERRN